MHELDKIFVWKRWINLLFQSKATGRTVSVVNRILRIFLDSFRIFVIRCPVFTLLMQNVAFILQSFPSVILLTRSHGVRKYRGICKIVQPWSIQRNESLLACYWEYKYQQELEKNGTVREWKATRMVLLCCDELCDFMTQQGLVRHVFGFRRIYVRGQSSSTRTKATPGTSRGVDPVSKLWNCDLRYRCFSRLSQFELSIYGSSCHQKRDEQRYSRETKRLNKDKHHCT